MLVSSSVVRCFTLCLAAASHDVRRPTGYRLSQPTNSQQAGTWQGGQAADTTSCRPQQRVRHEQSGARHLNPTGVFLRLLRMLVSCKLWTLLAVEGFSHPCDPRGYPCLACRRRCRACRSAGSVRKLGVSDGFQGSVRFSAASTPGLS